MSTRSLWVSIESITILVNGDVPGQSAPTVDNLPTDRNNPLRMSLGLTVPDDVEKPFFVLGPTGQPETRFLRLPKGTANGEIVLRLAAVAADQSAAATHA